MYQFRNAVYDTTIGRWVFSTGGRLGLGPKPGEGGKSMFKEFKWFVVKAKIFPRGPGGFISNVQD